MDILRRKFWFQFLTVTMVVLLSPPAVNYMLYDDLSSFSIDKYIGVVLIYPLVLWPLIKDYRRKVREHNEPERDSIKLEQTSQ